MKNILIVDDDTTFAEMMRSSIDTDKYAIEAALDGVEGLEKMKRFMPDIILLDVMMPKMNGFEFLKKVNEAYGENKIPIIITSNDSTLEKISEGVTLGIRGYIVKSNESIQSILTAIDRNVV
jgi:DNA-binding response OmpR family regulator